MELVKGLYGTGKGFDMSDKFPRQGTIPMKKLHVNVFWHWILDKSLLDIKMTDVQVPFDIRSCREYDR